MRVLTAVAVTTLLAAPAQAQEGSVDPSSCQRLASTFRAEHTSVTSAVVVPAGQFRPPSGGPQPFTDLPAICRVALTITPSQDSDIRSEIWMPLSGWNGKFQQVGNGAWGGSIQYAALADAVRRGYAGASTDTGHVGAGAGFAVDHPEKLVDFGYRAVHETAVRGKAAVAALYGTAPRLSYFNGCSGGGRQAFMEAQRFPDDFDAILAGAPGYDRTNQNLQLVMVAQAVLGDPASAIPSSKYRVLHQAALNACDELDGLKDGLVSNPMQCHFDPAVTACTGTDGPGCLTAAQVKAATAIYSPARDPKTGEVFFPGFEPGSEVTWGGASGVPGPLGMADDFFKGPVFEDPNWDFRRLDLAKHLELARQKDNGVLTAASANLAPFVGRGGKLLMYHGWQDPNISPRSSVNYYDRLVDALGAQEVEHAVRLYMVPGMGHCGGGNGPNVFDALTALERWREHGTAPADIIASQSEGGKVTRTRPLCPFPQFPKYTGSGNVDRAENFVCVRP